jgi:hypothetical protein
MALIKIPKEMGSTPGIVDNSNATAITIDSSENVGIGGAPATQLFVKSASNAANVFAIESADASQRLQFGVNTSNGGSYIFEQKAQALRFGTSDTERMRIDASGSVGIGTSSPAAKLDISGVFQFFDDTTPELRIVDSDDNNYGLIGYTDGTMYLSSNHGNEAGGADVMQFLTGGLERMRIDASGHLLVDTTDDAAGAGNTNAGVSIRGGSDNRSFFSVNSNYAMHLNRNTNDGEILWFAKNGGAVGSIGTTTSAAGTRFAIGAVGDPGIIFAGTGVFPATQITASDNSADLGSGTYRWKDIFLSGGVNFSVNANAAGMTSELLDDYEEGTWTPALAGYYGTYGMSITQGTRGGKYTKVGNLVTLSMEINSAGVAASGNGDIIVITGLPFNIDSPCVGSHAHTSIASFAGGGWTSINGSSFGHLGNNGAANNAWTWMTGGNVGTSGVAIRLTITYRAA